MHWIISFLNFCFRDEETKIQRGDKEINRGNVENKKRGEDAHPGLFTNTVLLLTLIPHEVMRPALWEVMKRKVSKFGVTCLGSSWGCSDAAGERCPNLAHSSHSIRIREVRKPCPAAS